VRLATACGDAVCCNDEYPLDERNRDAAASTRCRSVIIGFHRATGGVVLPGHVLTAAGQRTVFAVQTSLAAQLDAGALELAPARPGSIRALP
jgi:hypothetical protein